MVHQSRLARSVGSLGILSAALVVLISGCGSIAKGAALQMANTTPAVSGTPTDAYAVLLPQPSGSAHLTWDSSHNNTLTVSLSSAGLAPASPGYQEAAYPANIISGNCRNPGNTVHHLTPLVADQYGAASSTTTLPAVVGGIPATGWNIALYSPGTTNQQTLLACAPILNPNPSSTTDQSVKTSLNGAIPRNGEAGAFGKAHLKLNGTTLTITLSLLGLDPGSQHAAHIHAGSCNKQGPVAYPLEIVMADSSGHAQVVTTINGVHAIPDDWYINVHNSTDLTTQAGFEPIACGAVFSRS